MRHRIVFSSRCSCRNVFLVLIVAAVAGIAAHAQKGQLATTSPPKYDLKAETKLKGTVDEVKLPAKGSEKEIAHLVVKDGANSVDVYLCPKSFFDDMGMAFAKGDEITITGSKVKQGDAEVFLAREIVKGSNDTFSLRDAKGDPVWSWKH